MRLAALLLGGGLSLAAADTPVHCLLEQMYGEWTVKMSEPLTNSTPLSAPPSCEGVALPRFETMRLLAPNRIAWEGPDTPTDDRMGTFTMVYDEGWEASFAASQPDDRGLPAVRLWGFLDWAQVNATTVASHCGSVTHGTFHSIPADPTEPPSGWGCYSATKNKPIAPRLHSPPAVADWAAERGGYRPLPALPLRAEMPRAVADPRPDSVKYAGLPASVDWDLEGKVEMMRDQLTCGSCFAFASTSMLASRGRIAGVSDLYLSPQDVIVSAAAPFAYSSRRLTDGAHRAAAPRPQRPA